MKSLGKIAVAALAVIALAILAMVFLRGGGEEAKVDALLRQALEAGKSGDTEKCISYIASDYSFDGVNYEQIGVHVRRYIGPGKWTQIELRSLEVGVDGETATATMKLFAKSGEIREFMGQGLPLKLNLHLKKAGPDWKITGHRVEQR